MEIQDFIKEFEEQFEKIEPNLIKPDTEFKKVEGWDSLTAMLVIDMINEKFGKTLTADEIRKSNTISDLFNLIKNL